MKYIKELEKWFFSFWVVRAKITYLLALVILVYGFIALDSIPKESDPEVNLPMVSVTTRYDWVAASIIDDEITEEIEESLEDIESIASINSTSSEWSSSISIEIQEGYDVEEAVAEIEDAVDTVKLPSWVDSDYPIVSQRDFTSTDMFSVLLYWDDEKFSFENLLNLAASLQAGTQSSSGIKEVSIDTNTLYDIRIILSKEKLDTLWISIDSISSAITNNSIDSPIWSYELDGTNYTYTLSGKIKTIDDLMTTNLYLWDRVTTIANLWELELYYWEERINKYGAAWDVWYNYISLTYSKLSGVNIFDVTQQAKEAVESELSKDMYSGLNYVYSDDEAKNVTDDFSSLTVSAIQTLVLVFLALIFFVWLRESTIATFILPLSFLLWFIVVNYLGETFNRMTTFAFVLAFWIAIDTIIIIIEWAAEKVRQWFNPRTAVLIALKEYKSPVIVWTLTTISAFIPILTLPWVMWIYLSFIPMVVFIVLIATLFVSLTIAWPIFILFSKPKKKYEVFHELESVMNDDELKILHQERANKKLQSDSNITLRDKIFHTYSHWYRVTLQKIISKKYLRIISTITPLIILFLCIFTLSGKLWFEIFPQSARDEISISLSWPDNATPGELTSQIEYIENLYSQTNEIEHFTLSITGNRISSSLYLLPAIDRINQNLRDNTTLQTELRAQINQEFASDWFNAGWATRRRWPGWWNPVWIKLVASNVDLYSTIIDLTEDFENYLIWVEGIWEVSISAADSVWWIDFTIDKQQASILGVTQRDIFSSISSAIRWQDSITIKWANDDHQVELYLDEFIDNVTPSSIENINLYIWWQTIKAWSVLDYTVTKTSPNITREWWDIQVSVTATVQDWKYTSEIQANLEEFASQYEFPLWISYKAWWENAENADLISSVLQWIFVAFFFIFAILVYQFNSYAQPLVILYSVFMSISGVIVGLYVTWNPLSMPAGIWFISLMWIVVNDAIVMVDKINNNLKKGMKVKIAIVEWAVSRLNPILVTTITTVAGILPIALQDVFWAWLGYTVAFGLTTGSFMTLFSIPTLYYAIESRKYKK